MGHFIKEKDILKSRDGFTLIEIVVVLVILSILAVVAVVKYVDMTSDSQQTAVDTVLFDAAARYNLAYAKYMLLNSVQPTGLTVAVDDHKLTGDAGTIPVIIDDDFIDFTVTWTKNVDKVEIKVTGGPSWFEKFKLTGGDVTKTIPFHPSD